MPLDAADAFEVSSGGGTQNRTGDAGIFSPSLYRLSYPADKQSDYRVTPCACKMRISERRTGQTSDENRLAVWAAFPYNA